MVDLKPSAINLLANRLLLRQQTGLLRELRVGAGLVDFCSNDYLGLARSSVLKAAIQQADTSQTDAFIGATGSRLLAGHTLLADELEVELAAFYQAESALIFNSGFDANLGLLACLPQAGDTLLTDELIHASMIDGARLNYAARHRFRHNDLNNLATKLHQATVARPDGQVFVAVESVYSMDGDVAPLREMADLCDQYGAGLLVDEAHATGIFGAAHSEGLVVSMGLQDRVLARVHTFGKALGVHGAAVVGPVVLRDYLINFARPFIYSTALPTHSLLAIQCAHRHLQTQPRLTSQLHEQIAYFRQQVTASLPNTLWSGSDALPGPTPIQCLIVPGNENARRVAVAIQRAGLDVRAILSPTVPAGQERLRICLHTFNTNEQIDQLITGLQTALAGQI